LLEFYQNVVREFPIKRQRYLLSEACVAGSTRRLVGRITIAFKTERYLIAKKLSKPPMISWYRILIVLEAKVKKEQMIGTTCFKVDLWKRSNNLKNYCRASNE